jgi:hypothetical protein
VVIVGFTGDRVGLKLAFIIFAWVGFFSLPFILRLPADNP